MGENAVTAKQEIKTTTLVRICAIPEIDTSLTNIIKRYVQVSCDIESIKCVLSHQRLPETVKSENDLKVLVIFEMYGENLLAILGRLDKELTDQTKIFVFWDNEHSMMTLHPYLSDKITSYLLNDYTHKHTLKSMLEKSLLPHIKS